MTKTERHVVVNTGTVPEKLREAFSIATGLCDSVGGTTLTILCNGLKGPTKGLLTVITDQDTAKQLVNQRTVIKSGLTLELMSERTFDPYPNYDVVLGIYLDRDGLDKMDAAVSAKGVVFLSWLEKEAIDWIQRWSPTIHGTISISEPAPVSSLSSDVIFELTQLTRMVNLSTGITHSSDKATAIEMFKGLKKRGCHCAASDIKNWAIGHGWQPCDANDLAKLTERYLK